MKNALRKLLSLSGFELKRIDPFPIGSAYRPVGNMKNTLEDIKSRGLNCKAILDIGANRGDWSIMANTVFPDARFCLVEPQVEMEESLKTFCATVNNSLYYLAGAASIHETKYLTVWDDLAGSSFLPKEEDNLKQNGKQRVIEMITIDEIIESGKFEMPQLVKLDVQGYELEALKGAKSLFGKTEAFILEVSLFEFADCPGMPILSDVVKFMAERDYVTYDFTGFARRPLDGALGQCDICFVKKDSFLRASNDWGRL